MDQPWRPAICQQGQISGCSTRCLCRVYANGCLCLVDAISIGAKNATAPARHAGRYSQLPL